MPAPDHKQANADAWVTQFVHHISAGGAVLDVACGGGRHSSFLRQYGYPVTAIDRDMSRLDPALQNSGVEAVEADLETGAWPFEGRRFAGIIVVNYLYRPLFPRLLSALEDGGVLIYRTFQAGNEAYGRPANPDFLLAPGELLTAARGLKIVAYEAGYMETPKPAVIQRICAIRRPTVPPPQL